MISLTPLNVGVYIAVVGGAWKFETGGSKQTHGF
jgi:hypothetical protein